MASAWNTWRTSGRRPARLTDEIRPGATRRAVHGDAPVHRLHDDASRA